MSELCAVCGREHRRKSDRQRAIHFCSNDCQSSYIQDQKLIKQIDKGNYDNITIVKMMNLGYSVTIARGPNIKHCPECDSLLSRNTKHTAAGTVLTCRHCKYIEVLQT